MVAVMQDLEPHSSLTFEQVMVPEDGSPGSRALVVTTFLAVLELTRLAVLRLYQGIDELGVPRGTIHLRPTEQTSNWGELVAEMM